MKRGFTLIELLAVIILLGLIAAITIPIITNIIEVADNKGLIESAENYIEAVEYSLKTINIDKDFNPTTCVVQKTGNILCDGVSVEVEVNKNIPTSGVIKLKNGVMQSVVDLNIDGVLLFTDLNKEFVIK